ncbi:MAG: Gfo/Idh/MocA family protein [Mycobacteriales bacterium]|jgi:virulence factor
MRVGIVGLGGIAERVYLPYLTARPGVDVIGITSRTAARVAEVAARYRVPPREDLDALLAAGPDVVFVAAATAAHPPLVAACLDRGMPVYVEKPLATDVAVAEDLARRAARRRTLLAVGFNRRFAPLVLAARDWVGTVEYAYAAKHRPAVDPAPAAHTVHDDLIHLVDLLVWLLGPDAELAGYVQRTDPDGRLRLAAGTLTAGDATGQFAMHRPAGADRESLVLSGPDGDGGRQAEVTDLERAVLAGGGERRERGFGGWEGIVTRRGFAGAIEHVLGTLADPEGCVLSAERTLPTHRLTGRLLASAG